MKRQRESEIAMGEALEGDFRKAMRTLASAVSIVSTAHDDRRFGMTATAVCSLSMQPPTLLVCVNQSTSLHHPLQAPAAFASIFCMPTRTTWRERSAEKALKPAFPG
jgi:flavin reductase (DIM6/NTAB) family NADH-FMN oxidoreductase RutF